MFENPTPWIVLALIVLATLFFKGYLKIPTPRMKPSTVPEYVPLASSNVPMGIPATPNVLSDLESYPAYVLGLAFAKAAKREAEHGVARTIANQSLEEMMARFQSPFSPPAPPADGPGASPVGVNP